MAHSHDHTHDHHHHHHADGNLALAFWLNTAFAIVEVVGGFYTNSVAILSDALHDFGDSIALGSAWFFERKSRQQRDATYTYGYKRFSLMGAFINAVVLTVGSVFILMEAFERIIDPVQPDANGMILLALLGVIVNGVALLRLRKGNSLSEKMISLHFIEDVVGWIAVLIGSVIMKYSYAPFLDPVLSIGISVFILVNVYRNMRGAFQIILQGVPHNVSEERVRSTLHGFSEVESIHDVHLWTLDGKYNILTVHIVLDKPSDLIALENLKNSIKGKMREINVDHATIEFEVKGMNCQAVEDHSH